MVNWLRRLFSATAEDLREVGADRAGAVSSSSGENRTPLRIDQLYVEPDKTDDFDRDACQRLLAGIATRGAETVEDVLHHRIVVSLEEFFEGNRCKHSIAANVDPSPPYDTAESWYELLKQIRAREDVEDVVVEISMVEPYADGRVGTWPCSDTIWIYSELDRDTIASLVAPLEPDEVRDASVNDPPWDLKPPFAARNGMRPYWVWWD